MDFYQLSRLREKNVALRLLHADNAPLIVSFFYRAFLAENRRSRGMAELQSELSDTLTQLRAQFGEDSFPNSASAYLESWSSEGTPYLRKYYSAGSDEPQFDLSPDTERVIHWLQTLGEEKPFIGTESRLLTIFRLLRDIVDHTETNPAQLISKLEAQKAEIEREIDRVREGAIQTYDSRQVAERVLQAGATSRELLADFRKVEENFRELDRTTRERIATGDEAKGALLDKIFGEHDIIWNSDQGRSFSAFWEFLMSRDRQEELQALVSAVSRFEGASGLKELEALRLMQRQLIDAGEPVYKTNNLLSEQLRKFLSSQAYLENKRIAEIIKAIEKRAAEVAGAPPRVPDFSETSALRPHLQLVMDRTLFPIPSRPLDLARALVEGVSDGDTGILYEQVYVDIRELKDKVRQALGGKPQVSLAEIVERFPVSRGMAEVVAYLALAVKDGGAVIDETMEEQLTIASANGGVRLVRVPRIIFTSLEQLV